MTTAAFWIGVIALVLTGLQIYLRLTRDRKDDKRRDAELEDLRSLRTADLTARDAGVEEGEHHPEHVFVIRNSSDPAAKDCTVWLAWPRRDQPGAYTRFSHDVNLHTLMSGEEGQARFDQRNFEGPFPPKECALLARWADGNGEHQKELLLVRLHVP